MLRHLKMELKRQQQLESSQTGGCLSSDIIQVQQQQQHQLAQTTGSRMKTTKEACHKSTCAVSTLKNSSSNEKLHKRTRGRRSSKPAMEKRRRARINQCLDILKSYVLGDSSNLNQLGIDTTACENQDEETIARTILKSSGLINRHRGRKNPNKLEKADILELTVDYVRRLHEQRDELIQQGNGTLSGQQARSFDLLKQQVSAQLPLIAPPPTPLTSPLTLRLPAHIGLQATPPSPPPSSASSSPQPLLAISSNICRQLPPSMANHSDALDLSSQNNSKRAKLSPSSGHEANGRMSLYKDGIIYVQAPDGCWRPWNPATVLH